MKRAVLIGSATYNLLGTERDLELMHELLEPRGFDLKMLEGERASRAGILAAMEALIRDSRQDDVALIYYSGHGGLAVNPDYDPELTGAPANVPVFQFLVPTDLAASTPDDFRGLLDIELSDLVSRLTDKTMNVTVILDCCHAARQARTGFRSRALPRFWEMDLPDWARTRHADLKRRYAAGNPHAVRLCASGVMESAVEYENADGDVVGMFTESLHLILSSREDWNNMSWLTACQWARERVLSLNRSQRVDVEGPARRLIFDTREADRTGVLRFFYDQGQPSLRGGRLHGVHRGSVYALLPHNAESYKPELQVGEAVVDKVLAGVSRVTVTSEDAPEGGLQAFLVKETAPMLAIRIEGSAPGALLKGIDASDRLCAVGEARSELALATVRCEADLMQTYDHLGLPVGPPRSDSKLVLADLKLLARAWSLRIFTGGKDAFALDEASFTITWGRVVGGEKKSLPNTGEMLSVGDAIFVEVDNRGSQSIFVNIFNLGLKQTISLMTDEQRSGIKIMGHERRVFGFDEETETCDWNMIWPCGLESVVPLPESIVVFVTDHPQDLSALETGAAVRSRGTNASGLQALVEQLSWGVTRDVHSTREVDVRYAVTHIDFMLNPHGPTGEEASFLRDNRPDSSLLVYATRGSANQRRLALRLDELILHRNRAFSRADIRVDILVTTNSQGVAQEVYQVGTFRFPNVRDGDSLSFDKLLVFHGTARDFLDIAIWVSRLEEASLDLGDLLQRSLNDSSLQSAVAALGGPQLAAMNLALGATATLVNTASKLLTAACGRSIGLYRTSFLADENFGLGRHPSQGYTRIQDFSLAYTIQAVDEADDS